MRSDDIIKIINDNLYSAVYYVLGVLQYRWKIIVQIGETLTVSLISWSVPRTEMGRNCRGHRLHV